MNKTKAKKLSTSELLDRIIALDPKAKMIKEDMIQNFTQYLKKGTKKLGSYEKFESSISPINKDILLRAEKEISKYVDVFKEENMTTEELLYYYSSATLYNKNILKMIENIKTKYTNFITKMIEEGHETPLFSIVKKETTVYDQYSLENYKEIGKYRELITKKEETRSEIVKISSFSGEDFTGDYSDEVSFFLKEKADYKFKKQLEDKERNEEEEDEQVFLEELKEGLEEEENNSSLWKM